MSAINLSQIKRPTPPWGPHKRYYLVSYLLSSLVTCPLRNCKNFKKEIWEN